MKISRDGFGDRFVGDCGRVFVFACVYQKSNGLTLFVIGQLIPLLFLRKLLSDVVFREAERGDGSPGVLFSLPLQFFRSVSEKTKEDRAANCHNEGTHLASWFDVGMESGGRHITWRSVTNA